MNIAKDGTEDCSQGRRMHTSTMPITFQSIFSRKQTNRQGKSFVE